MDELNLMDGIPLTITQVAMITQTPKSTLRYWEKIFSEFLMPPRSEGGRRTYFAADVRRINEIKKMLKNEGYTIVGARKKLGLAA
ncbi:MAG: MerR family transcriptional regulator [Planctomycetota bacterium]